MTVEMNSDDASLAGRLRQRREAAGYSLERLAQEAKRYLPRRTSVTHTKLRNYETGRTSADGADLIVLSAVAVALGTTLDDLLPGSRNDGRQAVKVMRLAMGISSSPVPPNDGMADRRRRGLALSRFRPVACSGTVSEDDSDAVEEAA